MYLRVLVSLPGSSSSSRTNSFFLKPRESVQKAQNRFSTCLAGLVPTMKMRHVSGDPQHRNGHEVRPGKRLSIFCNCERNSLKFMTDSHLPMKRRYAAELPRWRTAIRVMDLAHVSLKASLPRRSISGERARFLLAILDMRHAGCPDDQMSLVGQSETFAGPSSHVRSWR